METARRGVTPGPGPTRSPWASQSDQPSPSTPLAPGALTLDANLLRLTARIQAHGARAQALSRQHFPGQLSTGGGDRRGAGEAVSERRLTGKGRRRRLTEGSARRCPVTPVFTPTSEDQNCVLSASVPHLADAGRPRLSRLGLFTHACSALLPRPRWREGRAQESARVGRPGGRGPNARARPRRADVVDRSWPRLWPRPAVRVTPCRRRRYFGI